MPWLKGVVIVLSFAGVAMALVAVIAVWFRPEGLRCILSIGIAFVATVLTSRLIAHLVFIDRPFVVHRFTPLFPHGSNTSFPSTLTAYFALLVPPMMFAWRRMGWVLVGVTVEVALACLYVGVHYGTDVVAGALIGAGFGAAAWFVLGKPNASSFVRGLDRSLKNSHLRPG